MFKSLFILYILFFISCGSKRKESVSIYRSNLVSLSSDFENCFECLIVEESNESRRLRIIIQNLNQINYSYCEDEYIFYKPSKNSLLNISGKKSYTLENNDTRSCLDQFQLIEIENNGEDIFFTIELLKFKLEKVK